MRSVNDWSPEHQDRMDRPMDVELGHDAVPLFQAPWTAKKRPHSPLVSNAEATSKRLSHMVQGQRQYRQPNLLTTPHSLNLFPSHHASLEDKSFAVEEVPAAACTAHNYPLWNYPQQECWFQAYPEYDVQSTQASTPHHNIALSRSDFGSVHPVQPPTGLAEAGLARNLPLHQPSATGIANPPLPLTLESRVCSLGPLPASVHDHTHSYTPDAPLLSGLNTSSLGPIMHGAITGDPSGTDRRSSTYPQAYQMQDQVSAHHKWSLPPHGLAYQGQASSVGAISFEQSSPLPVPYVSTYAPVSIPSPSDFPRHVGDPFHTTAVTFCRTYNMHPDVPNEQQALWPTQTSFSISLSYSEQDRRRTPSRDVECSLTLDTQDGCMAPDAAPFTMKGSASNDDSERFGAAACLKCGSASSTPTSSSSNSSSGDSSAAESRRQSSKHGRRSSEQSSSLDSLHNGHGRGSSRHTTKSPVGNPASTGNIEYIQETPALPQKRKSRKERGRFDKEALIETNQTRLWKACVGCRQQRVRCKVITDDHREPCMKCQNAFISKSGKVMHRSLCVRTERLTSIVIARAGGLRLTRRWEGTKLVNITSEDWADTTIRSIKILQGLSLEPIEVKVRKFNLRAGDVNRRTWMDAHGRWQYMELAPFCLADIHETAKTFRGYLDKTTVSGLRQAAHTPGVDSLVRETFDMVVHHYEKLTRRARESHSERVKDEADFFFGVMRLVWSLRHTTGSVWLTGPEKLGMSASKDPNFPVKNPLTKENEVPLPRLVIAQFDSIQNQIILPGQLKNVLRQLEKRLGAAREEWFTMYLSVFMILHQISVACKDRYRWAREQEQQARYGAGDYAELGHFVENLQKASVPLLAYWDYYRLDHLDKMDWNDLNKTKILKTLEPDQLDFLRHSVEQIESKRPGIPPLPKGLELGCWEHELFFVSRMFMSDWNADFRTFQFMDM